MKEKLNIEEFKKMWSEGWKIIDIASKIGVRQHFVTYIAAALGLPPRRRGRYNLLAYNVVRENTEKIKDLLRRGYSVNVIASMLGVPRNAVLAVIKAYNIDVKRGAKKTTKVERLWRRGYTIEEIARETGLSPREVEEIIKALEKEASQVIIKPLTAREVEATILALLQEKGIVTLKDDLEPLGLEKEDVQPAIYKVLRHGVRVLDLSRKRGVMLGKYKPKCYGNIYFYWPKYSSEVESECHL